ncbi:MAG TPA: hypothetical protein V6C86_05940 [Oculatellaceae cyanobacterium]
MRIELVYAPGCNNYKKAKTTLEAVIAEERLPCHIEMVEHADQAHDRPAVRVDGQDHHVSHFEALRDFLSMKWKELTESQFRHAH